MEREIAATDQEIDELVYRLYGITDEERKIIEGQTAAVTVPEAQPASSSPTAE